MAEWEQPLLQTIHYYIQREPRAANAIGTGQFHLAVLVEPYLSLLLNGQKNVESRFCRRKCIPYKKVHPGDTLILKRSSGPVVGLCKVTDAIYFDLSDVSLAKVREQFGAAIAVTDEAFWKYQEQAKFASLFLVSHMTALPDVECHKGKGDRRAWVVMQPYTSTKERSLQCPLDQARELNAINSPPASIPPLNPPASDHLFF